MSWDDAHGIGEELCATEIAAFGVRIGVFDDSSPVNLTAGQLEVSRPGIRLRQILDHDTQPERGSEELMVSAGSCIGEHLGKGGILLARMSILRNGRVLDRMKKLEIYPFVNVNGLDPASTTCHFEGTHTARSAWLKSLAARDCPAWCSFCVTEALFTLF